MLLLTCILELNIMDLVGKKITFKVQKTALENDTPVLLSFPAGVPNDVSDSTLDLYRKKSGSRAKQTLTCDSEGGMYRGIDYGTVGASADAYTYAVGAYDQATHTMKIYPAHHPFAMSRLPAEDTSSDAVSNMTAWERRNALTEEFGSRKRKRAAKAAESNIISIENISGAAVVEANMTDRVDASEKKPASAAQTALKDQRLLLLPTYNEFATELPEAYPLDSILPEDIRNMIAESYTEKFEQLASDEITLDSKESWIQHFLPQSSGNFVSSLVADNIVSTMTKHKKSCKYRACGLIYLDMLLSFYSAMSSSSTVKKDDLVSKFSWPIGVLDHIAANYAISKTVRNQCMYQRSKQNRYNNSYQYNFRFLIILLHTSHKTLLCALALALHLSDFELNLTLIAQVRKALLL